MMPIPIRFSLADALATPPEAARESVTLLSHGMLELRWYTPPDPDEQTPHSRDELYIVACGNAVFVRAGERVPCAPGDVLFVAAGVAHQFAHISPGFGVWVVFAGAGSDA